MELTLKLYIYIYSLSLLPWRSDGRSNFGWGLQKLNNVDSNNDIQLLIITILKIESTVDIHRKMLLAKTCRSIPHEGKRAAIWAEDLKAHMD